MPGGGRKYRLLMYEYMINRWWPVTLLVALFIFLNIGVLWGAEWYYAGTADNPLPTISSLDGMVMIAAGVISLLFTIFLLVIRKMAYVQLFDDHMRMVTPFLRLNISYKRIQRTSSSQLYNLFPAKTLSSWKRDLIEPLAGRTANIVYLSSYPLSRAMLKMFLSPFFFFDVSAHFVLLLDDWLKFSIELDSRRVPGRTAQAQVPTRKYKPPSLLDDLTRK